MAMRLSLQIFAHSQFRPAYHYPLDVHQLNLILNIIGTPNDETIRRIGSPRVC